MRIIYRSFALVLAAVALLLVSLFGAAPRQVSAQTPATPPVRTITVVGTGTVNSSPDTAFVTLGANIAQNDLSTAMQQADAAINAILAAVKKLGVTDNDIQTVQYSVFVETIPPNQPPNNSNEPKTVYHVVHILQITVSTSSQVGGVISAAVAAGANQVNNIEFTVKDRSAKETQARKAALDDAKARATELATNSGGTLGQVISIQENSAGGPVPFGVQTALAGGKGGGGPDISGGQLAISISLTVTYQLQ